MIYTPKHSAKILKAMNDVLLSNNGYADIGYNPDVANALHTAGFVVIESKTLHGNPTFKAFTKDSQAALRGQPYGISTYSGAWIARSDGIDYEELILARQEGAGYYD